MKFWRKLFYNLMKKIFVCISVNIQDRVFLRVKKPYITSFNS